LQGIKAIFPEYQNNARGAGKTDCQIPDVSPKPPTFGHRIFQLGPVDLELPEHVLSITALLAERLQGEWWGGFIFYHDIYCSCINLYSFQRTHDFICLVIHADTLKQNFTN
jgi:hypothetical protein